MLLRFSEVGWQVWNEWAHTVFASCFKDTFHPMGVITAEEWRLEEERIQEIRDNNMRTAQLANLEEVKELRAKALQSYNSGSPSLQSALLEAVGLLKSIGVSMLTFALALCVRSCQQSVDSPA